jgi:hypothetical protein
VTDSAINLAPGTYSVLMTDAHGCTSVASAQVQSPTAVQATSATSDHSCFAECTGFAEVNVSGGSAPYSYLWSNGGTTSSISNGCPGNVSVDISDAMGCTVSSQFIFTQDPAITIATTHTDASCISCPDGAANGFVSGGFPPYSYSWTPGNFNTSGVTGLVAGTYIFCVTDSNNCTKCDSVVITEPGAGVDNPVSSSALYVYPNPAGSFAVFAFVTNEIQNVSIQLFDMTGQVVRTIANGTIDSGEHFIRLETSEITPGVYFYTYTTGSLRKTGSLVVSH